MEIIQSHIPDIPAWKNTVAPTVDLNTTKDNFIDFIKNFWLPILLISIVVGIGTIILYFATRPSKEKEDLTAESLVRKIIINQPYSY